MTIAQHPDGWTDPRIERLTQLWADGLSGTQIAIELGGLTRSAVIGKVHRLALPKRMSGINCNRAHIPNRPRKPKEKTVLVFVPRKPRPQPAPKLEPLPDSDIPFEQRKSILDLTPTTCRWPIGEPSDADFFYCGSEDGTDLTEGLPYCRHHSRVAYTAPTGSTRRQWRGPY